MLYLQGGCYVVRSVYTSWMPRLNRLLHPASECSLQLVDLGCPWMDQSLLSGQALHVSILFAGTATHCEPSEISYA